MYKKLSLDLLKIFTDLCCTFSSSDPLIESYKMSSLEDFDPSDSSKERSDSY